MKNKSKPQHIKTKIVFDITENNTSYSGFAECPYCGYETAIEYCDAHIKSKSSSGSSCSDCEIPDCCSHFNYYESDTVIFSKNSYINKKKYDLICMSPGIGSYNRLQSFINHIPKLNDAEYWYYLREAYQYSDNTYYGRHYLRALFSTQKPYKNNLMRTSEIDVVKNLPSKLKIFRAMTVDEADSKRYGVSWTLDYDKAKFFKDDYGRNHATQDKEKTIMSLDIYIQDVIAYWCGRKEEEIIYIHNKTSSIPVEKIVNEMENQNQHSEEEIQDRKLWLEILNRHLFS